MLYNCKSCSKQFKFHDAILFCPYCGEILFENVVRKAKAAVPETADALDAIWGASTKKKEEIASYIGKITEIAAGIARAKILEQLPAVKKTEYESRFGAIRQCAGRKVLLVKVRELLDDIKELISAEPVTDSEALLSGISGAAAGMQAVIADIAKVIGCEFKCEDIPDAADEIKIYYTTGQLTDLFRAVEIAHEKYVRCVNENNMFAAFPSDSGYGRSARHGAGKEIIGRTEDERAAGDPAKEYRAVMDFMERSNAVKYDAFTDEDYLPHVNAFWYGLKRLALFTDNRYGISANGFTDRLDKLTGCGNELKLQTGKIPPHDIDSVYENIKILYEKTEKELEDQADRISDML